MHICLILAPGFPILTYAVVREIVQIAADQSARPPLTLEVRSVTGAAVSSSDGVSISPDITDWTSAKGIDLIAFCAGADPLRYLPMGLRGFVSRSQLGPGTALAGFGLGVHILAALGHLDGHHAVYPDQPNPKAATVFAKTQPAKGNFHVQNGRLTTQSSFGVAQAITQWLDQEGRADLANDIRQELALPMPGPATAPASQPGSTESHCLKDPRLAQMQSIMDSHLNTPLPLGLIAQHMDMSAKQMRHRCRKQLGLTPAQFYLQLRLERAQHLVRDTGLSVQEVAGATGFASPSAFTRSFKTRFGASPREMRNS